MEQATQFYVAHKWVFLLIPLPLLVYLALPSLKRRRTALLAPFFHRATEVSGLKPRKRAWITPRGIFSWISLILCWVCLLAALSMPQLVQQPDKKIRTARSFLIAADISNSMSETDWVVGGKRSSRWDAVKTIMKDFVRNRKSDQIALVMFGTHAYLQSPLTTDLQVIDWLLDQTAVGMAGETTAIGEAIGFSIKVFREDTVKQRVMLLLTDGNNVVQNIQPMDAAIEAKKDSITIYTLGIGKAHGSSVELNEPMLKDISAATSGRYFNAMDERQLKEVYAELDKLEPIKYEEQSYKPVRLLYMYPLAAALLFGMSFQLLSGVVHLFKS